ncbi:MAG: DUF5106 domain-containing protein [Bacteroidetes bacterium]|nr:DUF5106 domain-containing protein [Bacteroidota bacterium]MBL6943045.1 DUF5106 domain-containing protein [Bacteroidales bacterium]
MINLLRYLLLISVALIPITKVFTANPYEIKIRIDGYQDSVILLTSYYGEKIKLVDTAYSIKHGEFVFMGEEKLPSGIYMVVSADKKKLFEFLISGDQTFNLNTSTSNYALNMKVLGSKENKVFYSYLVYNEEQYQLNISLLSKIDSLTSLSEENSKLRNSLDSVNKLAVNYKLNIIENNQGMLVSSLLNAMRDIEIPDSIKNSTDSSLAFKYYKKHYWDYFDLSDSSLLRTPIFMRKVNQYFDQVVVFNPDSVISAIDTVISNARPSKEVVGYLVWHFISEYQNPKFMGFDKVFVHLVENYFSKENISNTTTSILTSLQERADKIKPILLNQPAPDLLLIDTTGVLLSFKTISNNYTILFFWDTDCGICGKEITELKKIYDKPEYDIEVYAVNVNSDLEKWKKALIEKQIPGINVNGTRSATKDFHDLYDIYGTPVIYVLDKNKKIVAKRIGADKIAEFIDNFEKR